MLFEEASEPTVDNDAGATAIATEDDEPKASPAVDEAPSDAELEEEAEQLQREAEALEQQLTQRETADPTVSPSAPTRTTMPTISFDDESMQEAMRQAFTS